MPDGTAACLPKVLKYVMENIAVSPTKTLLLTGFITIRSGTIATGVSALFFEQELISNNAVAGKKIELS